MSLKVKSTSVVQIFEVVFQCERRFCWSNSKLANRCCSFNFFSFFFSCSHFLLSAFWCCSMFSEHLLFPFSQFQYRFSSHFHSQTQKLPINFLWHLLNVWNLCCFERDVSLTNWFTDLRKDLNKGFEQQVNFIKIKEIWYL